MLLICTLRDINRRGRGKATENIGLADFIFPIRLLECTSILIYSDGKIMRVLRCRYPLDLSTPEGILRFMEECQKATAMHDLYAYEFAWVEACRKRGRAILNFSMNKDLPIYESPTVVTWPPSNIQPEGSEL